MRRKGRRSSLAKHKNVGVRHTPRTAEHGSVTPTDTPSSVEYKNVIETSIDAPSPQMKHKGVRIRSPSVAPEPENVSITNAPSTLDNGFISDDDGSPVRRGTPKREADAQSVRKIIFEKSPTRRRPPNRTNPVYETRRRHKATAENYCKIAMYLLRKLEEGCWHWKGNTIWNEAVEEGITELSSQAMRSLALQLPTKLDELDISPTKKNTLLRKLEVAEIRKQKKEWGDKTVSYVKNKSRKKSSSVRSDETLKNINDNMLNKTNDNTVDESVNEEEARETVMCKRIQRATSCIYSKFIAHPYNDITKQELSSLLDSVTTTIRILSKYDISPKDIFAS